MKPYHCQPFDVHDQELIEGAKISGKPEHIAVAISTAVDGFKERICQMFPNGLPRPEGRPALMVKQPGNFFDYYVICLVLQELADDVYHEVIDLYKTGEEIKTDKPATPDVIFD